MEKRERVNNQEELHALVDLLGQTSEYTEDHLEAAYGLVREYMSKPDIDAGQRSVLLRAFFNCPYYHDNYTDLSAKSGNLDGYLTEEEDRQIEESMAFVGLVRDHVSEVTDWLTSYLENQGSVKPEGLGRNQVRLGDILKKGRRGELSVPELIESARRVLT